MAHNGSGIRDTARVLGINKNTVISHLKKSNDLIYVNTTFLDKLPDEQTKISLNHLDIDVCISAEADEQWSFVQKKKNQRWLWYILEKTTRKVLAYVFGDRTDRTYKKLVSLMPQNVIDRLDTDDWGAYKRVKLAPIHRIGKDETWRIERKNLDLRTRIKRLARRTICFSKLEIMHNTGIGLFIMEYLF